MRNPLTVIIPCKNERHNIRQCVASIADVADEILIADSGSTDGTRDIVADIGGCRVIRREYVHSGDFKNWAIPQSSHPWVLIIDADERVTGKLASEIRHVLSAERALDGYYIYRENYFMGHRIRFSGWQTDRVLGLFRRDLGRYVGDTDHAKVHIASGRVGRLRARLRHDTYWNYDQFFRKFRRYTTVDADRRARGGRRATWWRLLLSAPLRFLHTYVVRLGFLDGRAGIQVCALTAFYSFMKEARLWETHCAGQPTDESRHHPGQSAETPTAAQETQPLDVPDRPAAA